MKCLTKNWLLNMTHGAEVGFGPFTRLAQVPISNLERYCFDLRRVQDLSNQSRRTLGAAYIGGAWHNGWHSRFVPSSPGFDSWRSQDLFLKNFILKNDLFLMLPRLIDGAGKRKVDSGYKMLIYPSSTSLWQNKSRRTSGAKLK